MYSAFNYTNKMVILKYKIGKVLLGKQDVDFSEDEHDYTQIVNGFTDERKVHRKISAQRDAYQTLNTSKHSSGRKRTTPYFPKVKPKFWDINKLRKLVRSYVKVKLGKQIK